MGTSIDIAMAYPIPKDQFKQRLLKEGLVTEERFEIAAEEARRMNQDVADVLVAEQLITYDYLYKLLSDYFGVERAQINARGIDDKVLGLVEKKFVQEKKAIPFSRDEDGTINVAMEDPSDLQTVEFLEKRLGARVRPYFASPQDLARGLSFYSHKATEDFKDIIKQNIQISLQQGIDTEEEAAKQIPIVELVNNLIGYAAYLNASDVHVEAMEDEVLVRFRVDGILHEILSIPRKVLPAILARIKLLGALKVDEHQKPQDGRFRHELGDAVVDIRVSIIPTLYGEKIVLRLLTASQRPLSLNELGMNDQMREVVEENVKKSYGMVLVTGPTGSGKTTTLYSILSILNRPEVNIVTVEDPIEYNIKYINQVQINPKAGITFASGLRSILRQDPNIIMVGEIRDEETAEIAVQSALTGHIVLSSLHTNDAPSTIARMLDMNVPSFLVAAVLNIAAAQRLVRKICIDCIESYDVDEKMRLSIEKQIEELHIPNKNIPKTLYRGKGCKTCNGIGYKGRMGIFEILEVDEDMRSLITSPGFTLEKLIQLAEQKGMKTMFEDGLEKAALGQTTIEEVLRVIRE